MIGEVGGGVQPESFVGGGGIIFDMISYEVFYKQLPKVNVRELSC